MARIHIQHLFKSYPTAADNGRNPVLDDISLDVAGGEFITFFGPNGSGKSTLLKVIAGIEPYDGGNVIIDSKSPQEAKTALVFQNYGDSLMPWLSARDNILFPYSLKKRKDRAGEGRQRLSNLLRDLEIDLPQENYPYQLSGGQQQLVAILRTLIYKPDVILMDEPFSSLDYQTRSFMQMTLLDIWQHEKPTILFVSHDIEEAIFLADRLVLLSALPASIKETKTISFARPRTRALFESNEFFEVKRACLQTIKKELR
jgi:NitT/TauT family transport system ATP-binding protein